MFERWQFVDTLIQMDEQRRSNSSLSDPMIPVVNNSRDINTGLEEELKLLKADEETIQLINKNLRKAARKAVQTMNRHDSGAAKAFVSIRKREADDNKGDDVEEGDDVDDSDAGDSDEDEEGDGQDNTANSGKRKRRPRNARFKEAKQQEEAKKSFGKKSGWEDSEEEALITGDMYEVTYRNITLPVTAEHLTKLHSLFHKYNRFADYDVKHSGIADARFLQSLFVLLLRYQTLQGTFTQGAGFQAAIPGTVFDVLRESFNVKMECFASPLNCRYGRYCSAFPDTDSAFGSVGSFFTFRPTSGAYEANPPFIPELITAMAKHMENLLSSTTEPLMFIIIIPMWEDREGWYV